MVKDIKSAENDFFNWLSGQVSSVQLSNIYTVFASIENFCIDRKVLKEHLFETTDIAVVSRICDIVDKDQTFRNTYKKQYSTMSRAVHYYLQYIKERYPQAEHSAIENGAENKPPEDAARKGRLQFLHWLQERGYDVGKAVYCLSVLKKIGEYARRLNITGGDIFLLNSASKFSPVYRALKTNDAFIRWDKKNSGKCMTVLNGYMSCLNELDKKTEPPKETAKLRKGELLQNDLYEADSGEPYRLVCAGREYKGASAAEAYLHFCEELARRYPLGFRSLIGRPIRAKGHAALEKTQTEPGMLKMSAPIAYISSDLSAAVVLENTAWLYEMCAKRKVSVSMHEPAAAGKNCRPAEPKTTAHGPAEPKTAVHDPTEQIPLNTDYFMSLIGKAEENVLAADLEGITFDDLKIKMGLTMAMLRRVVKYGKHLVEIKEKLYHEDAFVEWEEGAAQLDEHLEKLMEKNNGYVSAAQLYKYAHIEMSMFLNDNDLDDERSVYEMAQHLFEQVHYKGKTYAFTGKMHISRPSDNIGSSFDICCKYAEEQGGVFKFSDLAEHLAALGIKAGNLRNQLRLYTHPDFFYYEEGTLISADSMHIDDEWKETVKNALDKLFRDVGDHIVLREIQPFWFDQLPWLPGGRQWTPLLLQSVLRFWGEEFGARTIIAMDTQGMETLHTMLVQKDSPIQNFGDAVISVLIENGVDRRSFEAEELRQLLAGENLIRGNELIYNMPKALGGDERFSWDAKGENVTILV